MYEGYIRVAVMKEGQWQTFHDIAEVHGFDWTNRHTNIICTMAEEFDFVAKRLTACARQLKENSFRIESYSVNLSVVNSVYQDDPLRLL